MSSTTTNVGIRLTLQGAQEVESGLGRVQALAGDAARTMAGLAAGTFSAAAFTAWVKGAIDAADETDELAQKTGLLAKEVAGLKLLFEQEGLGDAFGGTMAKLARQASEGNKAFAAMGVSVNGANGQLKSTRQLLGEVANKFAGYADGPEKAALAMELFGKSGADLIPLLNGGGQSLDEFDRKAEQLGLTLSAETAAAAAQFNDQLFELSKNGQGAATFFAGALLPALVAVTAELAKGGQQGSVLTSVSNGLATAFEAASVFGLNVAYVLKQVGNELGGLAAQAVQVAQFNFSGAAEIGRMMKADAEAARKEIDATSERILKARLRMTLGVSSPDDQSDAEARRLGLKVTKPTAPDLLEEARKAAEAARRAAGVRAAADREAAKAWADAVGDFAKIAADAEASSLGLSKAQARLVEYLQSPAYKNASEPMRELALQQAYVAINAEQAAEAMKIEQAAIESAVNAMADLVELRQQAATGALDQLEAQRLANEEIGLEGVALVELQNARLLDAAAALERRAVLAQDIDFSGKMSEAYRQEAQGLRDLAAARTQGAQKQEAVDAAKAAAGEWQKTSDNIERALTDALMRGFENGKSFGENLGDSVSNYFKTSVAEAIASAITKAIMSALASTEWGRFFSGVLGGGGGGGNMGTSLLSSAAQSYIDGLLATNSAYGTAASGSAAGASSASWISAVGYAALIAAAVMVAKNLYEKGWNELAAGIGPGETNRFGYTSFTSDPRMGESAATRYSPGMTQYQLMDKLGILSEKWAFIASSLQAETMLFGRKLGAYGYEAQIAGGDSEVGGFARYKGGLFRSNKTVGIDIDQRDAANVDAIVESTIEGARAMARAMGLSEEAINSYTGSIKVNMKGAETAEEQSKRMAEAMDDLQFSLLKAAAGGKYSKDEFEKMMEGVRQSIEAAGISTGGIADILVQGMTGRLSKADVGDQLADMIIGGIYNSIASNYAGVIAQAFTTQIITPIFTALAAGVPISQAISQAAIQNVVATAQNAAQALNAIFNDAGFRQAIGGIQHAISGVAGAVTSVKAPKFGSAARSSGNQSAQERYNLETQLLTLLDNTDALRRRELASLSAGNRALQQRIWALEDSKAAVEGAMDALNRAIEAQRDVLQGRLDTAMETEQSLKDVFDVLRDNIGELRGEVVGATDMSAARGRELIRSAIGGTAITSDELAKAIGSVRTALEDASYSTRFERDRATLALAGELSTLAGVTEQGLSAAEQQVSLLEDQLAALDLQAETAQKQVDALMGVDTSVKTVDESVRALTLAMAGYSAAVAAAAAVRVSSGSAPGGSSGGAGGSFGGGTSAPASSGWTAAGYWSKNADLRAEYENLIRQDPGQSDARFNKDPALSYRDEYLKWHWETIGRTERRKFAQGGYYPGGLALVGEEGPELINFKNPGMVYTAAQTQGLLGNERTDRLLEQLISDLREFRFAQVAEAKAGNKLLKKWDGDGMPGVREVSA